MQYVKLFLKTIRALSLILKNARASFCVAIVLTLASGCGGGDGGDGGGSPSVSAPPSNASPAGIYTGSITINGVQRTDPVVGVVVESGQGAFLDTYSGGAYLMQFNVAGLSATGTLSGYLSGSGPYHAFPNAQRYDSGSLQATIAAGTAISGSYTTSTTSGQFLLTNQLSDYAVSSSLQTIAGTYRNAAVSWHISGSGAGYNTPFTVTVGADGTIVMNGNCTFSGQLSILDPSKNAYAVHGAANCGLGAGVVTGFSGLAYFTPQVSGSTAKLTFVAASGGAYFAVVASK